MSLREVVSSLRRLCALCAGDAPLAGSRYAVVFTARRATTHAQRALPRQSRHHRTRGATTHAQRALTAASAALSEARHIASGDGVATKDDESLYHVTQFADITWPTFLL